MKSKNCRYCGQPIGKTRKFLCDSCRLLAEIKADRTRTERWRTISKLEKERRKLWTDLTQHDQENLLFEKAKKILRSLQ